MGWYLKKAFRLGPIRLNLSKSGIGVSTGVKGFRVGTGPRGPYIHAGRGGIYYRKSLDETESDSLHTSAGPLEGAPAASPAQKPSNYWPILVFLSVTMVTLLVSLGMSETIVVPAATALFVICVVVAILERRRQPPKLPQVPPDQF